MRWTQGFVVAASLGLVCMPGGPASAQSPSRKYGDLLKRLPPSANAMLMVDLDGLLDSPMGRREHWRDETARRPSGVLGLPGDASKFVVAAGIDLRSHEERWKIGMIQAKIAAPPLAVLAAREGGYVEQIGGVDLAWTPRDLYLFSFPERVVGFVTPADRQRAADWISNSLASPRTFPPGWADRAIFRADAGSQVVMALNLAGAVSPRGAVAWLNTFQSENVKRDRINFDMLGTKIAGAKSALLQVDVRETIQGTLQVDFEEPVDILRPIAKELVLGAMEDFGASIDDIGRWTYDVKGTAIVMTGPMTEVSLRRIIGILSAPRLSAASQSEALVPPGQPAAPPGAPQPSTNDPIVASQRYYRSIVDIAETLKSQRSDSAHGMKLWYDRSAKQIEDLPLLYVDNDLLEWGSKVARGLREVASGINYSSKNVGYKVAGTANNYYGGYGYGYGGGGASGSRLVETNVIKKQSSAVLNVEIEGRWQALETSIADTRRAMVERYKVDF